MDFSFPPEYLAFKKKVSDFAQKEMNENMIQRDLEGIFSKELWQKCADFGLFKLAAPAEYGGATEKVDLLRAVLAMEGFGYGCLDNGMALAVNAHMWPVQLTIAEIGNEEQKRKYLPCLINGKWLGAHGLTEPQTGSDVFNMKMSAKKVDGGYILNGIKHLITLGPIADVAMVVASTKPELGKWGLSAFLVEKGMEGFRQSEVRSKMGLRTVPIGELILEDCFVPQENLLGKEGAGFSIINHSLEYDRCCVLAGHLGAMERQLEDTVEYAKTRQQYGQPIGHFQSVSNRIADMKLRLETSRLLLYKVAWLKKEGKPAFLEATMLKLHLSESFLQSSLDAVRTRGGRGYLTEHEVERDFRDSVGPILYAGTSDIQRNIIARILGL